MPFCRERDDMYPRSQNEYGTELGLEALVPQDPMSIDRGQNRRKRRGEHSDPRRAASSGSFGRSSMWNGRGGSQEASHTAQASLSAQKVYVLSSQSTLTLHARNE